MSEAALLKRLAQGTAALGITVDERTQRALLRYLSLLTTWNERINLTAIRDADGIIDKHFVDSLAVLRHLPASAATLVDVGSGAGLPGAVLALARPTLQVTLVESSQKKAAFLQALKRELALANVTVVADRIETMTKSAAFDVAISRATFDLPVWLALGERLVVPGGLTIGMEGSEQHPLPPNATRHVYRVANAPRALVLNQRST